MTTAMTTFNNERSKKNKDNHFISSQEKARLWNVFETEVVNPEKHNEPLECLYNKSIRDRENCEMCQSSLAYSDEGFLTCTNNRCGIIYKDLLDHSPEWRYYGADDNQHSDPTRCGMPINPLLEESSFGCKVSCGGGSSYEMRKIRRYTEWQSMPHNEKTLYEEFQKITTYAQNAGISKKIIDDAIRYHKQTSEYDQKFRSNNKNGIIAASIYISCKKNNLSRTTKEIATIFHLDKKDATYGCKMAQKILIELEKDMDNNDKTTLCNAKPDDFIERYCSKLNINTELTNVCKFIAKKIHKNNLLLDNAPHSISAGVVYFISQLCNLNVSKRDVKNISGISEVTINKCYKKLEKITKDLVPSVILNKYSQQSVPL